MDSKKILSNFLKWYKKNPVVNTIAIITAIRTSLWLCKVACYLILVLLNWVSSNYDVLVTFFTSVKNLVSSLIYKNHSLIHCYKSFFVRRGFYGF